MYFSVPLKYSTMYISPHVAPQQEIKSTLRGPGEGNNWSFFSSQYVLDIAIYFLNILQEVLKSSETLCWPTLWY